MSACSIDECERPVAARGWCLMHYKRWRKHGDPLAGAKARTIKAGDRFGWLTVTRDRQGGELRVECRCDCGTVIERRVGDLTDKGSCGCRKRGATNPNWRGGLTEHPLYETYHDMIGRCTRPTHARWSSYGGRGITVCDRWREDFWAFVADVGERPAGTAADGRAAWSLDRIDNDGNYEPGNVRWADATQQRHNQRRVSEAVS